MRLPAAGLAVAAGLVAALVVLPAGSGQAAGTDELSDQLDRARERRQELEVDLGAVTAELEELAVRIHDARHEREQMIADVLELAERAEEAEEALRTRALAAYMGGTGNPVNLLLAAGGPAQALERSRLLGGLGLRERAMIEHAAATSTALLQRRAELDSLLERLEVDEQRSAELQDQLAAAFEQARSEEVRLATRHARQRRIERGRQRGTYACPIARPFHFRDTWGAPRSGGRRHKGVDIFGRTGAEVYAITNGRIARHSNSRLGGVGLYIAGDDGNLYYYAHLREILPGAYAGARVQAGQLIARNGSTGNATANAPHIHMEVRPDGGRQVNPYPFAAATCL